MSTVRLLAVPLAGHETRRQLRGGHGGALITCSGRTFKAASLTFLPAPSRFGAFIRISAGK